MKRPAGESLSAEPVLRLLLGGVAIAAGATGVVLLALPGSTPRYFSWDLRPSGLTSLIGGFYVASLFTFGHALGRPWREVRGLVAATLALTAPILIVTFVHLDVFDLGRWQAWAWVVLFAGSPLSFGTVLLLRRRASTGDGPPMPRWARALAALLALVFLTTSVALWWSPDLMSGVIPIDLPSLGGRVLGCWSSFLAVLAGWSAMRGRWDEARVPLVGVVSFMAGALVGALRDVGALQPPATRLGYGLVLVILLALSGVLAAGSHISASEELPDKSDR